MSDSRPSRLAGIPAPVRLAVVLAVLAMAIGAAVSPATSAGRTLRVAPGATGNCTSTPCGSIDAAVAVAQSGDVIALSSGSYGDQTIKTSGSAAGWATNVVVQPAGDGPVRVGALRSYVPNLTFRNLEVNGIVYLYPSAHRDRVEQLNLTGAMAYVTGADNTAWVGNTIAPPPGQDGLQIKGLEGDNAVGTLVQGNTIGPGYRVGDSHTDCIQLLGAHQTTIRGNRILECANTGIQIGSGAGGTVNGVLIEDNVIDECRPQRGDCPGYHTIIMGSTVANSVSVLNNQLNGSVGIAGTEPAQPVIRYNTAVELPCTPKTDYNIVEKNPCGPNDRLKSGSPTPTTAPTTTTTAPKPTTTTTAPKPTTTTTAPKPTTTTAPKPTTTTTAPKPTTVTDVFVQRVHSKAPTATFAFSSGKGPVRIDLVVPDAWFGRAWAEVTLYDSANKVIGSASTGPTNRTSLTTSLPKDGVYVVKVTSKPGEVNLRVTHAPAP
jgi:hypothetical protein